MGGDFCVITGWVDSRFRGNDVVEGMMAIGLDFWLVKSVRGDMVKGRVRVVLEGRLDEEFRGQVGMLRLLASEEIPVDVTILERQQALPMMRLEMEEGAEDG